MFNYWAFFLFLMLLVVSAFLGAGLHVLITHKRTPQEDYSGPWYEFRAITDDRVRLEIQSFIKAEKSQLPEKIELTHIGNVFIAHLPGDSTGTIVVGETIEETLKQLVTTVQFGAWKKAGDAQ